ncbi:MAG: protein-disulfide reductase DsbD domain-containing protein [Armatimonadota bacterium]
MIPWISIALACAAPQAPPSSLPTYLATVAASSAPRDRRQPPRSWFLSVTAKVAPGWHVYTQDPGDEFSIPTKVAWNLPKGFVAGPTTYPAPTGDAKPRIWEGEVRILTSIEARSAKPGTYRIKGTLSSQGCNAGTCLPPAKVELVATVVVAGR